MNQFQGRLLKLCNRAFERNCILYLDAEQTSMQYAIHCWAQQLSQQFNVGSQHVIMNTFQCYLKHMALLLRNEIRVAETLGYNKGLKIVRGAYMLTEREAATKEARDSPVHETIQDTHACYDECVRMAVTASRPDDLLLIGTHNTDSVQKTQELMKSLGIND